MRAFFRTLINILLFVGVIWLIARFTTLDDRLIAWFKAQRSGSSTTVTACQTPWGVTIPAGSSIFAYESDQPDGQGKCHEEQRMCVAGELKGTYTAPYCQEPNQGTGNDIEGTGGIAPTGAACRTPWGQAVQHGNYMVAYESPSSCRFQRRMCVDGQLLGKFQYNYCMIGGGQGQFGGGNDEIYAVDGSQNAASAAGVSPSKFSNSIEGQSPYAQGGSRQYSQVQYGGSVSNQQLPDDYRNQSANGKTVAVQGWNDNKLNPKAGNGTPGNYKAPVKGNSYQKYDLTEKGCKAPWGAYVDHGQSIIAYKASKAQAGGSCEYERRTCMYGKLNGSFSFNSCGGMNSKTWQYGNEGYDAYYWNEKPTPTPNNNRSCRTAWGETVKNGDYVRAYKYATAPWSDGCEGEIRYCRNGQLDGSYSNKSCKLTQPTYQGCYGWNCGNNNNHYDDNECHGNDCGCHGNNCNNNRQNACYLPWGGKISHGSSVTARSLINGQCYSENRSCNNGYLNGSYSMQSCTPTQQNLSCALPWGGYIGHGQSVEAFSNPTSPCHKEIRWCYNGVLQGSFGYRACTVTTTNPPVATTDSYGARRDFGRSTSIPSSQDTCQGDATISFACTPDDAITCTDIRKVEDDCCVAGRAKYESRTITCVR